MSPPVNASYDEAIAWFMDRIALTDPEFRALRDEAKRQAWWMAGISQLRLVDETMRSLKAAMERTEGYKDWVKRFGDVIRSGWHQEGYEPVGGEAARLQLIWRNAMQTAYNDARWTEMSRPEVRELRPYLFYDAIMDDRTSEICIKLDGTVLLADDPFWKAHVPPLHHNCRSTVRTLDDEEARAMGITRRAPDVGDLGGFGNAPSAGAKNLADVDLGGVDQELRRDFDSRNYDALRERTRGTPV